jgi:hypothetical protein
LHLQPRTHSCLYLSPRTHSSLYLSTTNSLLFIPLFVSFLSRDGGVARPTSRASRISRSSNITSDSAATDSSSKWCECALATF